MKINFNETGTVRLIQTSSIIFQNNVDIFHNSIQQYNYNSLRTIHTLNFIYLEF